MKKQRLAIIAIVFAAMVLLASGASTPSFAAQGNVYYTCPMPEHADVVMDKPGKCPKCGMDLVAKNKEATVKYTCPMHPDVVSDKPGKCPKCGMNLVLMKPDTK
jgi:ssDNA-binding Zn-finger/Zn-ribbon topoisomerase 1